MFRHNLVLFYRSALRCRSSFFINLVGLSTGLACTLLIYLWVRDERSVDKFHKDDHRLYQVMQNVKEDNGIQTFEDTRGVLAEALSKELPEVQYAVATKHPYGNKKGFLSVGDNNIEATELFASNDFLNVFSFPLLQGNKAVVLSNKNGIVLSREIALKLFRTTENLVGRTVQWHRKNFNEYVPRDFTGSYVITGIVDNPPANSTLQFDVLFSYKLCLEKYPELNEWSNQSGNPNTYLLLRKNTDLRQFNRKMAGFLAAKQKDANTTLFVRRYSDQYLYGKYENGRQAGGRIEYVRIFSVVAIFILVIACINFMNLATAKASKRLKEIGIKKTVGALRKTLVLQFLAESILTALLSAVVAVIWVYLLLPAFNNITGKALGLDLNYSVLSSLLLITLIAGLIAGSYPALYLSRFKPVDVLKGQSRPFGSDALVRKGLVVFQFAISIILIVAVLVVKRQVDFIQSKNLGYSTDHIIYFGKGGEVNGNKESDMEAFIHELKAIPGVVNAANLGYDITGSNGTTSLSWTGKNPDNQTQFHMLHAGYDLLETLNYKLVEGRTFSRAFGPSEKSKIILNNTAVQVMRLTDPVGKTVKWGDKSYEIIGVVEDFNFESVYEKVKPCFFDLVPGYSNVVVKISAGKEKKTINQLQQYYKAEVGFTLNFKFLNEQYQKLYEAENRLAALSQYFAGVAILISCLGLFGLAAFTAEKRRKEIGVRKVLGATVLQIVLLLSKDFLLLVVIAIFIGFPIAIWASSSWLQDFAYSAQINWWLYAFAAGAAIVIGLLTVTSHAINAAITNPVKSLRAE